MSTTTQILVVLLLVVANGVLAMAEIAIVSSRKTRLRSRAEAGDRRAAQVLQIVEDPTRFLSTVQVGITLIGIFAGAFGGATLTGSVEAQLLRIDVIAPWAGEIALVIVVLVITYLSLVIGELVPKRIGLTHPDTIARWLAGPMHMLSRVLRPAVHILSASTDFLLTLFRIRPSTDPPVTEGEIAAMLEVGTQAGVFEENEQELVQGVFRLADLRVASLMTPRHRVAWIDQQNSAEEIRRRIAETRHSRYLVCDGNLDEIVGMVRATDLLASLINSERLDIDVHLQKPPIVPESLRVLGMLDQFRKSGVQLAVIVDEYGGTEGIITLNDVLGEISADLDVAPDPGIVERSDGSLLIDGALTMDEVWETLDLDNRRNEKRMDYNTLAGFVVSRLGVIPKSGQDFHAFGYVFEVVDMDGHRVDKVLITRLAGESEESAED